MLRLQHMLITALPLWVLLLEFSPDHWQSIYHSTWMANRYLGPKMLQTDLLVFFPKPALPSLPSCLPH